MHSELRKVGNWGSATVRFTDRGTGLVSCSAWKRGRVSLLTTLQAHGILSFWGIHELSTNDSRVLAGQCHGRRKLVSNRRPTGFTGGNVPRQEQRAGRDLR